MDFPKSVPNIGLVGGKFVDENQLTGTPGSLIPSAWGNSITQEVLNVITSVGLAPDEADLTQLLKAIRAINQSALNTFGTDVGATNTIFVNFVPAITALTDGMIIRVLMAVSGNSGPTTLNVGGLGAKTVIGLGGQALQGGELVLGGRATFMWASSANAWILQSCQSAPTQIKAGIKSLHAVNLSQLGNYNSITSLTVSSVLTAAMCGQVLIAGVGGTTQTLPAAASLLPGSAYIICAQMPVTIKANAAELIANGLGVTANTLSMLAGEQLILVTNGASWYTTTYSQTAGRLLRVQVFDTPGTFTYTPTPGMGTVNIKAQGAGAPGAGLTTPSAGNVSMGAPGGAGSFAEGLFTAAQIGASKTVVVGATGTVGLGVSATNGGSTSVGGLISAPGGIGGGALNNVVPGGMNGNGGLAGTPSGANISKAIGNNTSPSFSISASLAIAGAGGRSLFGEGGSPPTINGGPVAAVNFGAGGSGCVAGSGGASVTGALGGGGIAILTEYAQ